MTLELGEILNGSHTQTSQLKPLPSFGLCLDHELDPQTSTLAVHISNAKALRKSRHSLKFEKKKMGESDQGLKLIVIRQISSGDAVYSMVTIDNNTVYTKFANIYVKSFHHNKKIYNKVRLTDIN